MTLRCAARRQLLKGACGVMAANLIPVKALASKQDNIVRKLSFYNRHTSEKHTAEFWYRGYYQHDALQEFNRILRDHRQDIIAPMDKKIFELLFQLQTSLENSSEIHIISGFRSPKTNAMLAAKTSGVAKKSYHTRAMAIDIAIPGVNLSDLYSAAKSLKLGGVGYYPRSGFIHLDTGRIRSW